MKKIIAWISLIILIISILGLNYIKFFMTPNENITETPTENSTSEAINTALLEIVENFNSNSKTKQHEDENIIMTATLKNHSIYITYEKETITTYEFYYNNFNLETTINNEKENIEKFNQIEEILIEAIQKRLNNEENIEETIKEFINNKTKIEGISKTEKEKTIEYKIDITKKIGNNNNTENEINNEEEIQNKESE